jgi:hypothetical protein
MTKRLPILQDAGVARPKGSIDGRGGRPRIVPADVRGGRFDRARIVVLALLIGVWRRSRG